MQHIPSLVGQPKTRESSSLGRALGLYGVRDPASAKTQAALTAGGATADTIASATRFGDVMIIAVVSCAVEELAATHGAALDGKIVVDTTNHFGAPVSNNLASLEAAAAHAEFYHAINLLGRLGFAEPTIDSVAADLFYYGPEGD